jgi:putative glycosyl hydrolase-like family 6 (GHL6) protein
MVCDAGQGQHDPGWWLTPHRMLQTNLREIDATMDLDQYVQEVKEFGANLVLFNVGGIVANYPTELEYHWRNTHMKGDLVGEALTKLHAADVKMIGRFDFSKINEEYAAQHPKWLYVSEKGEHVALYRTWG